MIFHGDLNYQGHGDLKSDLQPSFHLKYQSICYTTQFKENCMLLPQFANCFSIYRLNKLTITDCWPWAVCWLLGDQWRMTGNRLKLNNDKTEGLLVGYRRRVSVSQDNHSESWQSWHFLQRPCWKSRGLQWRYWFCQSFSISSSRSEKLQRSVCHPLTKKAFAQLMCSFVLSRLDYCNSLLIDIN